MKPASFIRVLSLALLLLLQAAGPARAQDDRDNLLGLIGADAGLCIEVKDLKKHLPQIEHSEFFRRLQQLDLYQSWVGSEHYRQLLMARASVERLTGRPFGETIGDMFGESVVVAVYPATDGQAAGVLVTRASGPEAIRSALDAWNRAEPHRTETLEHLGQVYHARTRASASQLGASATIYYVTLGRNLALSDSESRIRQVIELEAASHSDDSATKTGGAAALIDTEKFQQARESLSSDSIASAYFDPRSWDGFLDFESDDSYRHRALCAIWRRCESLIAGVRLSDGPVLELIVHYDGADASPKWDRFIERAQGDADFRHRVPRRAIAAVAGRHDIGGLKKLIPEFLPQRMQRQWDNYLATARGLLFGLDLFDDVLPELEPNWGAYIVPGTPERIANGAPLDGLIAFQLPDPEHDEVGETGLSLRAALDNALRASLNLIILNNDDTTQSEPAVVRSEKRDGVMVHWIEGLESYQPAYALGEEYLLIASTPELISECLTIRPEESLAAVPRIECARQEYCPLDNQLLYVDVVDLRNLIADQRELFIHHATTTHGWPLEWAKYELERVEDVLQLVDTAFLAGQINEHRLHIVLGGVVAPDAQDEAATAEK